MNRGQVVVVGTGLSGMVISLSLAKARVSHVLVGPTPNDAPRLGESINLEGTLDLLRLCPDLASFFYDKTDLLIYLGDFVARCDFRIAHKATRRAFFRLTGFQPPKQLVHVDRVGFDAALFRKVTADPHCTHITGLVAEIQHNKVTDNVESVTVRGQESLACQYVFDATNQAALVAQAAQVQRQLLTPPQRIVFTHFKREAASTPSDHPPAWQHHTSLLRLSRGADGMEGFAWCIPLGDTLSVGTSTEEGGLPNDDVLARCERAFAQRGISYRSVYPESSLVQSLKSGHFIHDRAWGNNWVLVGPSFCQTWYMSAAGVGSSLAAATMAPYFMASPAAVGRAYEAYMRELLNVHSGWEWLRKMDPAMVTEDDLKGKFGFLLRHNVQRLLGYAQFRGGPGGTFFAKVFHELFGAFPRYADNYCVIRRSAVRSGAAASNPNTGAQVAGALGGLHG